MSKLLSEICAKNIAIGSKNFMYLKKASKKTIEQIAKTSENFE